METQSIYKQKEAVPQEKEEINWVLVIILAIFTGGIGVLIYFGIYFSKSQNKGSNSNYYPSNTQKEIISEQRSNPYSINITPEEEVVSVQFCPNCGVKLERERTRFCPYCGTNVL
ncbi:MAG: zinc ribbon domain-containing protein [Candidatus Lokiarchaeota archaeon]|nr:zinc ribbon domain-containing protein [Candidatus Lokiarchaeota archaeon]